ncbi:unnamed protein product [Acanthoscelides obtectus]|uniref:Glucose-methanol-choline oxidoreductase N-terminal domain-containing protein n=1 Tax=Acanthoscelides obtectus TaxID=200917 RepID=A0A9P0LWV4_ACAOB|nr:unnamed protein product [Acanthoscelides obtectus]CAK1659664.1 Glucose dehydrogenase [FAD, quinone] [Acanthoscelides obtectus]
MRILLSAILLAVITLTSQESLLEGMIRLIQEGERQFVTEPADIPEDRMLKQYDFIVVGSGTAGCVVANRLSENPDWNVLLVEAGRTENYIMDVPIMANFLQFTESNWAYKTEPSDKFCVGMDGQQCNWPRGKVVGGSSVLNYMIYTRGNRRDYDNWAKMGNTGWSYEEVLPYFRKIENFSIPEFQNSRYHSTSGYLQVGYAPHQTPIAEAIVNSSIQAGLPYVDYNGPTQTGVSRLQVTLRDGVRDSASRAYLHPIRDRPNLHMKKYSMVKKILIDPSTKVAYGVEFVRNGKMYRVKAKKEVILSAGAINSPQLLMLSGVGPQKHLKSVGIPVLSNIKVGYNLMDHIAVGGLTFIINQPFSLRTEKIINKENLDMYFNHHKGPLSIPGNIDTHIQYSFR